MNRQDKNLKIKTLKKNYLDNGILEQTSEGVTDKEILDAIDNQFGQKKIYMWSTYILPNGHFLNPEKNMDSNDFDFSLAYEHSDFDDWVYTKFGNDGVTTLLENSIKMNVTYPYLYLPNTRITASQISAIRQIISRKGEFDFAVGDIASKINKIDNNDIYDMEQPLLIQTPKDITVFDLSVDSDDDVIKSIVQYYSLGKFLKEERILKEEFVDDEKEIFTTKSPIEVANRIKASSISLRILWDRKLNRFFVCDAYDYIHGDMVRMALNRGYYGDMKSWELDEYLDDYGRNVIYYIYAPNGKEKETYGSDVSEDGYEGKFIYDFGVVTTRSDDRYKASPLAKALGKYKEHYVHNGWIDGNTPRVQLVDNVNESVVNASWSKIYKLVKDEFGVTKRPPKYSSYILPTGEFLDMEQWWKDYFGSEELDFDDVAREPLYKGIPNNKVDWDKMRPSNFPVHSLVQYFINYKLGVKDNTLDTNYRLSDDEDSLVQNGCIKVNSGDTLFDNLYVNLPKTRPTNQALDTLDEYIFHQFFKEGKDKLRVYVEGNSWSATKYNKDEYPDTSEIIKKITKYYANGKLEESKKDRFTTVVENEFNEINKFLYRFGFETEYVKDYEFKNDSVGMFLNSLQDDASVFPIALNKQSIKANGDDLRMDIKSTIAHEVGHGLFQYLNDVFELDELDEEEVVEEFARDYCDNLLSQNELYHILTHQDDMNTIESKSNKKATHAGKLKESSTLDTIKLFRFIGQREYELLSQGKPIIAYNSAKGNTTLKGKNLFFLEYKDNDYIANEATRFMTGIVSEDYVVVIEVPRNTVKKGVGIYSDVYVSKEDYEDPNDYWEATMEVTEYGLSMYTIKDVTNIYKLNTTKNGYQLTSVMNIKESKTDIQSTHVRFINKNEYNALQKNNKITPMNTGMRWSGKKSIFTFPLSEYSLEDYHDIATYINNQFETDYFYVVLLHINENIRPILAEYDVLEVEKTLNKQLRFDVTEDGSAYLVPEVRLTHYSKDDIIEIKKISNVKLTESNDDVHKKISDVIKKWNDGVLTNDEYRTQIKELEKTLEKEEPEEDEEDVEVEIETDDIFYRFEIETFGSLFQSIDSVIKKYKDKQGYIKDKYLGTEIEDVINDLDEAFYEIEKELPVPNVNLFGDKYGKNIYRSAFTEFGYNKFKGFINDIKYDLEILGYNLTKFIVHPKKIVYKDEYQIIYTQADISKIEQINNELTEADKTIKESVELQTAGYVTDDGSLIYLQEYHGEDPELQKMEYAEFSSTHLEEDTCIRLYKEPTQKQYAQLERIIDTYLDAVSYCKAEIYDLVSRKYTFYKVFSLYEGACAYTSLEEQIGNWTGYKIIQQIKSYYSKNKTSNVVENKINEVNEEYKLPTEQDVLDAVEKLSDKDDISYIDSDAIYYDTPVILITPNGSILNATEYDTHGEFLEAVFYYSLSEFYEFSFIGPYNYCVEDLNFITLNTGRTFSENRCKIVIDSSLTQKQMKLLEEWISRRVDADNKQLIVYCKRQQSTYDLNNEDEKSIMKKIKRCITSNFLESRNKRICRKQNKKS